MEDPAGSKLDSDDIIRQQIDNLDMNEMLLDDWDDEDDCKDSISRPDDEEMEIVIEVDEVLRQKEAEIDTINLISTEVRIKLCFSTAKNFYCILNASFQPQLISLTSTSKH